MTGEDWAVIRPALKAIIVSVTSLAAVTWEDQPDEYVPPDSRAIIKLNIGVPQDTGDEIRPFYSTGLIQDTIVTWSKFTLKVKCESYDQTDGKTAVYYLAQIRNRLSRRGVLDAFTTTKCALIANTPITDLGDYADDRKRSVATFDIRLALVTQELDPATYPNVETVSVTKVP